MQSFSGQNGTKSARVAAQLLSLACPAVKRAGRIATTPGRRLSAIKHTSFSTRGKFPHFNQISLSLNIMNTQIKITNETGKLMTENALPSSAYYEILAKSKRQVIGTYTLPTGEKIKWKRILIACTALLCSILSAQEPTAYARPITPLPPGEGCGHSVLSATTFASLRTDNPGAVEAGHYLVLHVDDLAALQRYIAELETYNDNSNRIIEHYRDWTTPKPRRFRSVK